MHYRAARRSNSHISSAAQAERQRVCILLLAISSVAGALLFLLRWQILSSGNVLDVAWAAGRVQSAPHAAGVNSRIASGHGVDADARGRWTSATDTSSSSTSSSSTSGSQPSLHAPSRVVPKSTDGKTGGVAAQLRAQVESYMQRVGDLRAASEALVNTLDGGEVTSVQTSRGNAGDVQPKVVHKWTYQPARSSGGNKPPLPVRVLPSPLRRLPGAPPSRYRAVMREQQSHHVVGPLPRPRDRPDAAASQGSSRLPWLNLPADVEKRDAVVAAAKHAWSGYVNHAWGYDELQPTSRRGKNSFGGLGATIVDSLDTLLVLNMSAEFGVAARWVKTSLNFDRDFDASVFETTIRVVGGLLSAFHLTGETMFVDRAREAADKLSPAFDISPSGIPLSVVNLRSGKARNSAWAKAASPLAEFGSTQLEMCALSDATGEAMYGERAEAVIRMLLASNNRLTGNHSGLWPVWLDPMTNSFVSPSRVTFGGLGDSFYEYLLKMWIAGGQTPGVAAYRHMWEEAMESMIASLVFTSVPGNWTYVAELDRGSPVHKMDHLACFVPGMLALGAAGDVAQRYLALAADLTHTCVALYDAMPTGLSPESVIFRPGSDFTVASRGAHNLHRPETVESLFYLWRRTGEQRWRDAGWRIFSALEKYERSPGGGYAGLKDVRIMPEPQQDDTQQSFFLAETLKYLYLLFADSSALDLDAWVLNTEAHPLRVTKRETSLLAEATDSSV